MKELDSALSNHKLPSAGLDIGCDYRTEPNYNLAPTQSACVLRMDEDSIVSVPLSWGLVPSWAKDASRASSMINARSETVTEKPSFRGLVAGNRCIVPMDGFYEWDRSDPRRKVPYFCSRRDGRLLLVAGLWTRSPASASGTTFCILTRESGPDLVRVHDRSPVHLDAEDALAWLSDPEPPLHLAAPENQPPLTVRRVSTRVNSVRNNGPGLLDEVDPDHDPSGQPPGLF